MDSTTMRFHCWLDRSTYKAAKVQAAIENRTLRSVVERALEAYCHDAHVVLAETADGQEPGASAAAGSR